MHSVFIVLLLAARGVWSQGVGRDAKCGAGKGCLPSQSGGLSLLQKSVVADKRSSRNLLVFFDGTGCSMNKTCDFQEGRFCESHIVDLYRQTSGVDDNQLTQYMSGVGTDDIGYSKVSRTLDMASGESVNMRAEIIYRWIVNTYRPGDRIFAFGHSRGTISARVLQGMINLLGVARPPHVDEAIQAFYKDDESIPLAFKASGKAWPDSGTVEFLGLFEAVLRTIIATKNIENLKQTISPAVKTFAHAMGLGEWRRMYEVNELVVTEHTQATQVWFMGQHGNIGGNVETNGVNDIPKAWMIDQAMASGMRMPHDWEARLNIDAQGDVCTDREVTGIDSNGWGFRNPGYCRQAAGFGDAPIKVHQSVKDRMALVPGWVPPQWCCGTYDFIEHIQWVSNNAYDKVQQSPAASKPQWVRVVLGELKNAKTRKTTPKWYARVQMWHSSKALADGAKTNELDKLHRSEGKWGDRTFSDKYPIPTGQPTNIFCKKPDVASCDFANAETENLPLMPAEASSVDEFLIEIWEENLEDDLVGRFVLRYDDADVTQMLPRDIDGSAGGATLTAKLDIYKADDPVQPLLGDGSKPAQCAHFYDVLLHRSEDHMCKPVFPNGATNSYKEKDREKCATFIEDITCNRCFEERSKMSR